MAKHILDTTNDLTPSRTDEVKNLDELVYHCTLEVNHFLELLVTHEKDSNKNAARVFMQGLAQIIRKYEDRCKGVLEEQMSEAIGSIKLKAEAEFKRRTAGENPGR